jgi:hypothetical protein
MVLETTKHFNDWTDVYQCVIVPHKSSAFLIHHHLKQWSHKEKH